MNEEQVGVSNGSEVRLVRVTAGGDLSLRGEDRSDVRVAAAPHTAVIQDTDQGVDVQLKDDGCLAVPAGWSVEVLAVAGDAAIRGLAGSLQVASVAGDLALAEIGSAEVADVGGDVAIHAVAGDCRVARAAEDVTVAQVAGALTIEQVGGDLRLAGIGGDVVVSAGGDIRAVLEPEGSRTYRLEAGADLKLRIPETSPMLLVMRCGSGQPKLRLTTAAEPEFSEGAYRLRLGEGGAVLDLVAGRRIVVQQVGEGVRQSAWEAPDAVQLEDAATEAARQVGDRVATLSAELVDRLTRLSSALPRVLASAGVSDDEAERIAHQAEQSLERAVERVRRQTERTVGRLERRLERAEQRSGFAFGRRRHARGAPGHAHPGPAFHWPPSAGARAQPRGAAETPTASSEAERLAILRLVEAKQLTAAEAERLLAALED